MLFNHGGNLLLNLEEDQNEDESNKEEVDECILDIKCEGNCDPVVHQAQQLKDMKLQGGRRSSSQENSENKPFQKFH